MGRLLRFVKWQIGNRLVLGPVAARFVNDARLFVQKGMTGATGNLYVGLHEFEDMSFVLHGLRPDDLFVDVGANVGSYTVLAGAAVGASCVSFEPIPETLRGTHSICEIWMRWRNGLKRRPPSGWMGVRFKNGAHPV